MKKINKKGFTLIELLAVIVVLAIILVITIPTVLGAINGADEKAFASSANSIASWFESQYAYCKVGNDNISSGALAPEYTNIDNDDCTVGTFDAATGELDVPLGSADGIDVVEAFKAAGASINDYSASVSVNTSGRACVQLSAKTGGKFDGVTSDAESSGC